jgi:fimbrial isopeptide formation D2 family protein
VPPIETPPAVTEHPVNEPGFEIAKTADPASGTRVDPGSVITYTVTGVNTGETALNSVSIVDDLSAVLENAVYNGDVAATLGDSPVVAEDSLSWTGALAVGERVTITYSVTVNGDAGGALLENTVSGVAVPPGEVELTPPPAETEHPVGKPGFTFEKTSDPASGTKVATGSVVTYTLTGVNTGETALDSVTITDDLGDVLRHAELKGAAVVKIGDREVAPAAIDGTELIWTGSLAEGETITITYAVTVNADAAGETLANVATASATPPGGETITTPPSSTEHPVLTPLAITGGQIAPWILALSVLLLICGGVLLVLRRRTETA